MILKGKSLYFVTEAVERHIGWLELELERDGLSEDAVSDFSNDLGYYRAILQDMRSEIARERA